MHLTESFRAIAIGALILIGGITIITTVAFILDEIDKDCMKSFLKKTHLIFWLIICATITTLIPNQKTIKEMFIASHITKSNIEYTKETLKDTIDYIIDKVENKEVKE